MSDASRLQAAFDAGALLRPSADEANTVDLARALASLCGVAGLDLTTNAASLRDRIGAHDHYVFVLVDGLGMNLIEREGEGSILHAALAGELRSVFPSSTAPALTSIATGLWPAEHAVPGWWTYLPDAGFTATILPFTERFTRQDARIRGATPAEAYPAPVLGPRMRRARLRVMPRAIAVSAYSDYSTGRASAVAYDTLSEAVRAIVDHVRVAPPPTYTYFYIPFVDAAEHDHGPDAPEVRRALGRVRERLELLASALHGRARIVITADHGVIEIPEGNRHRIPDGDPMLDLLAVPPSCEPRVPAFHVKPGHKARFQAMFSERYAESFALLTIDEVDALRLLGPSPLATETRRRLGDFVGVSLDDHVLAYRPDSDTMVGYHGGAAPAEARVPLIVF